MKNWQQTKQQYLSLKYKYMRERVTQPHRSVEGRNYYGLDLLTKEQFLNFALNDTTFNKLYRTYVRSKGVRSLAPSVDRRNAKRGYTLDNIQFLTQGVNSIKDKPRAWFLIRNVKTGKVRKFVSTLQVAKFLGHRTRVKVTRSRFVNLKTGSVFTNVTPKSVVKAFRANKAVGVY